MKNIRSIIASITLAFLGLFSLTPIVLADSPDSCSANNPSCIPQVNGIQSITIQTQNTQIINGILGITGSFALLFLIIGGFRYVMSQGDEKKVESAKAILKAAIYGLIIILLAWVILRVIESFIRGNV